MTSLNEIYKCSVCGNVVEVVHGGDGELVCHGQPMKRFVENTVDAAKEKHVPVVERTVDGIKVTVGSVLHPMEEKHYITFVVLESDRAVQYRKLNPGDAPVAVFALAQGDRALAAYEHCNLHGLWKAEA